MASYGHTKPKFQVGEVVHVKTREECAGIRLGGEFVAEHAGKNIPIVDFDWDSPDGFMYGFHLDDQLHTMEAQISKI